MTRSIRFIHAADLHLGVPIRGLRDASPEWAARLQGAIVEAYERVIDVALTGEVDFVVLAGDTFDTSRPSYGDYLRFFAGLERLDEAGIPVYLTAGNHDPFTMWTHDIERLPLTARLMGVNGPEFALYEREGEPLCLIGARSYYTQSWPAGERIDEGVTRAAAEQALASDYPKACEAPFMVGVIHTGLDLDTKKAPADPAELMAEGVDYWACGHLHKRTVRPSTANPRIVFPGCAQGRDIKETGERGCYVVELREGDEAASVSLKFIPTASVVFQQMKVDVSVCQTLADVSRLVQAELFRENGRAFSDEMVVRVTLVGQTALHGFLRRGDILEDLRKHINNAYPSFFCDSLIDKTRPIGTEGKAAEGGSLFASVLADMANEQRGREDVMINYVQNEFVKRGVPVPGALSKRVGKFNDEAEMIVLDLLREGGEGE